MAARHHLHFHIDQFGYLTEHAGWKSETREATDAELQMWLALCPEFPPGKWPPYEVPALDATQKELADCLVGSGPYTLNAQDAILLRTAPGFRPCLVRELLQEGILGYFEGATIHVSRAIPKGYYYQGVVEQQQETSEDGRITSLDLDPLLEGTIQMNLRPLMES